MAHEIFVFDQIVPGAWADKGLGISAKQVVDQLQETNGDETVMRVNSPGGSVWEALTIYEGIRQHGNVRYQIDGVALSAASWMGHSAKERVIGQWGEMMIHPPMFMVEAFVQGTALELREISAAMMKDADRLDKNAGKIAGIYAQRGKHDQDWYADAMKAETWFNADEAVAAGLVNEVMVEDAVNMFSLRNDSSFVNELLRKAPVDFMNRVSMCKEPVKDQWERMGFETCQVLRGVKTKDGDPIVVPSFKQVVDCPPPEPTKLDEVDARLKELGLTKGE